MTRENKLALIIGFGLVLVVGILVSDHLSAASRQQAADLSPDAQPAGLARLGDSALLTPVFPDERARQQDSKAPWAANGVHAGPEPRRRDVEPRQMPDSRADALLRDMEDATGESGVRIDHLARVPSEIPDSIVLPDQATLIQADLEEVRARLEAAENRQQIPFAWYTIKPGETLAKIAREKYGDESLWKRLHEINTDRIPNPNVVPSGVTIRLPHKNEFVAATRGGSAPSAPADPGTGSAPSTTRYSTYTVQPGESLSKVAAKFYGSGTKWRELYELNKDVIKNPDSVSAGTVLKVPAR